MLAQDESRYRSDFLVIDKLENCVITTIKSIDTGLKSYQSADGIYNRIVNDATKLSKFTGKKWAGKTINTTMFDGEIFQIILPDTSITAEQIVGLQAAEVYINNEYGIKLLLTVATY